MSGPHTIGLTGSIGMGKSTTARMFGDEGCAVWDADAAVHRLYARGGAAVAPIGRLCPEAVVDGAVSREALKAWIAQDADALAQIEAVVHPLVAQDRQAFLAACTADIAVCDIPLLFESGMEGDFDTIVVVSARPEVQRARVMRRPGMTEARFAALHAKQMPDADKRARADALVPTETMGAARTAVREIVESIRGRHA